MVQGSRTNLKDQVAQHVRDLILTGKVHINERIDQDEVARALGVSRLPVREALIVLESEGLIVNVARRGSFVAPLSPADFSDHFTMYGLLSGMAAARTAASDSAEAVAARLEEIQQRMRSTDDPRLLDSLNFSFHQEINRVGSSRRLRSVLRMLSRSMPTEFFSRTSDVGWLENALDEHDAIISAIRDRDPDFAAATVAEHFENTGEQAVEILRGQGFWSAEAPDKLRQ